MKKLAIIFLFITNAAFAQEYSINKTLCYTDNKVINEELVDARFSADNNKITVLDDIQEVTFNVISGGIVNTDATGLKRLYLGKCKDQPFIAMIVGFGDTAEFILMYEHITFKYYMTRI